MAAIVDYGYIRQTWLALASLIPNEIGRAALMGNWYAESNIIPYCIQGNVAPPWTPSVNYTNKVNSGEYSKNSFVYDKKGYGLAQWTSSGRKLGLYNLKEQMGTSIGALELGIAFATEELTSSYRSTLDVLLNASDFRSASDYVLHNYEKPQDQGIGAQETRADYSEQIYNKMHGILPPAPKINVTPYSQRANVGTVVRFNVRSNYDWGVNVPYGAELVKKERGYCYIKVNATALRRVVIRFFILSDTNIYQNCTINIYGVAPIPSARKTPFIYYLKPFLGKGR